MTPPAWARHPLARPLIIWALLATVLVVMNLGKIAARSFPDPDDTLRLVQVRDLLGGQGWFDLHQYRIDPPTGTLMHWSRLVDLPLAAMIAALTPLLGAAVAETVTMVTVPLLTLGAIVLVVERLARQFFDRKGVILACLALGLAPLLVAQVQPMRIDHHGWQIFTVVAAMLGLLPGRGQRGAILSAALLAAGLSISLEVLPIAAAFAGVFALDWLSPRRDARRLAVFLATLALSLGGLFLTTRGLADLVPHCDIVSPAHLAFFVAIAGGVGALAWARPQSRAVVIVGLVITGVVALAVFLSLAPACAAGPFGTLDPMVREYWYNSIKEGRPAWESPVELAAPAIAQGVIALAVLVHLWRRSEGEVKRWWLGYLIVTGVTFVTGLALWRSMAFVGALGAVPIGWLAAQLLDRIHASTRLTAKLALTAILLLALVPAFPGALILDLAPAPAVAATTAEYLACGLPASAQAFAKLPRGTVFAPLDVGPILLIDTPHSVVASGHHRAQAAIHDVIAAFLGSEAQAHALVRKHQADYLFACQDLIELRFYAHKAPGGFADKLAHGWVPDWLEPVRLDPTGHLALYRVRG